MPPAAALPGATHPMKGKEFEQLCLDRGKKDEALGLYTMGRYGVMASRQPHTGNWMPIASNPDFEGITAFPRGRQFIFDAKVVAGSSLTLKADHAPRRQLAHLLHRWAWGAATFFLIHFKERVLKTKTVPAVTVALPTNPAMPEWKSVLAGDKKSFSLDECLKLGVLVEWNLPTSQSRKPLPDVLPAIYAFIAAFDSDPTNFSCPKRPKPTPE